MKKYELKKRLEIEGVSREIYSLEGGLPNEKLCLDFENGKWIVYYSERGCRTGIEEFISEDDACMRIYGQIKAIITGQVR